ncbi:NADAR family protein [Candidatus Kaiserbacteria bacterium]|nr:NADAR family protein [Candidatus Kaiserbacteria bacterium]MCB9811401.1 NADAR family protein [Candidatus Nomurabacteria bacterium]
MFVNNSENTYSEKITDPVLFYGGEFGYCFSNFAAFSVMWQERLWQTSEHAFQAAGFDDVSIVEEIASATSAHDALKLAIKYQNKLRPSWEDEKRVVMKDICRAKISQHPYIEKTLRQTENAKLIEDSPKDSCWGRGADWQGQNWLGQIWMELRSELNQE